MKTRDMVSAIVSTITVFALSTGFAVSTLPALAQQAPAQLRTITITGHAATNMTPDGSVFTYDLVNEGSTPDAAQAAAGAAEAKVEAALTAAGIPAADRAMVSSVLAPVDGGTYAGTYQELVNTYRATRRAQVTVRDSSKLAAAMSSILPAGAMRISAATPFFSNYAEMRDKTTVLAIGNARRSADAIVSAANTKIVGVVSIQTSDKLQPVRAAGASGEPADLAAVVGSGSRMLQCDVTIVYEISAA